MRRRYLSFLLPWLLAGCTYGPVVDRSGPRSAVLLPGEGEVAIVYQVLRYRPATGVAAFPDGGIPRYLDDRILIAVAPSSGGGPRVLQRLLIRGVNGSGSATLRTYPADPGHLLVLFSEQPSTSRPSELRLWRLSVAEGAIRPYPDIGRDLAAEGRRLGSSEFGDVRIIAPDGTLLIGAEGPDGAELWVRRASGRYVLIDRLKHFYGVQGDELYYWSGDEARVKNWRSGAVRVIARYDPRLRQTATLLRNDPTVRAIEAQTPPQESVAVRDGVVVITHPGAPPQILPVDLERLDR